MKKILAILVVICFGILELNAQQNCSENLRTAERYFDEGLLDEIPDLLTNCIKNGFTKEEKLDAYKLLVQTYIYNDEYEKADQTMLEFLKVFPEYEIGENDSREFADLHKTYLTEPVYQFEILAGTVFTNVFVTEYRGVHDLQNQNVNYSSRNGIYSRVTYNDKIFDLLELGVGLSFFQQNYNYQLNDVGFDEGFTSLSANFSNMYLGLPISVSYIKPFMNFYPYAKVGFETSYLLSSNVSFNRSFNDGTDPLQEDFSLKQNRIPIDIRPIIELGVGYKTGKSIFRFAAGFNFGTISAVKKERFKTQVFNNKYYYEDDDFIPLQTYLSLTYVFSVYQPQKINQ